MDNHKVEESENIDVSIPMPWGHIAGRWYGNRKVRPILGLHGWLDNIGTWNNLLPLLPKHIGVLCIDFPGQGRSSKLPNGIVYHEITFLCVIFQIMDAYNWNKVSLLSHSMGSRLAFIFAALYPHKVDLVIAIDILGLRNFQPNDSIERYRHYFEKFLIEDDRLNVDRYVSLQPPTYTYEQMEILLFEGSGRSVELEHCKHLLERSIAKSHLYPYKYYFSRDGRVKYIFEITGNPSSTEELARRIRNIPYCLIKASESDFINEKLKKTIAILRSNNPGFEFHEVLGTHHVQLGNAAGVAAVLNPFISRHRPPLIEHWTLDDESINKDDTQYNQSHRFKVNSKL